MIFIDERVRDGDNVAKAILHIDYIDLEKFTDTIYYDNEGTTYSVAYGIYDELDTLKLVPKIERGVYDRLFIFSPIEDAQA